MENHVGLLGFLKDNLFEDSQSLILHSLLFKMMSLLALFMLQYNVVSSAYINILKTRLPLGKSLMYIKKSKGPKIEPWGTPIEIDFVSDLEPLYSTYGCMLER